MLRAVRGSRPPVRWLLLLATGSVVGAGLVFGGYLAGRYRTPPYTVLSKADRGLRWILRPFRQTRPPDDEAGPPEPERYWEVESTFVRLAIRGIEVPAGRLGVGGGLTSIGDDLLLLTHDGRVFLLSEGQQPLPIQVALPDNGYPLYEREATEGRFSHLTHAFDSFRYNDILYLRDETRDLLAASYTEYNDDESCYTTAVALLDISDALDLPLAALRADPEDWTILFRTEPCLPLKEQFRAIEGHMAGGRLAFAPPYTLFLGSGDYHWDGVYGPDALAQREGNHYGKVVSIDLRSGRSGVISRGNRNMQGIALDREGQLWVVEHGVRGGDELNRVVPGANFGWPLETLGTSYNRIPWPAAISFGRHDGLDPPTFAWLPSIATSSLALVESFHDTWDGDLLVGTLGDQSLHRVRIQDERVLFAERIPLGKRVRDIQPHGDGTIVLWTDDRLLLFMTVAEEGYFSAFLESFLDVEGYAEPQRTSVRATVEGCMQCHSMDPGAHHTAPSLAAIHGAPIGSTGFPAYSDALRSRPGSWTTESLVRFISDPEGFAPGTSMPGTGAVGVWEAEQIALLLQRLRVVVR
jgi:cytochrome c2